MEIDLCVQDISSMFGPDVKYILDHQDKSVSTVNAFDILMHSQKQLSKPALPRLLDERNGKDRLYNEIIHLLESKKLSWHGDTVNTHGRHFVCTLTDVLWYLAGHHDTLQKQSMPIPDVFWVQHTTPYQAQKKEYTKP